MHDGKFVPTVDQENLIRSLQTKFHKETAISDKTKTEMIHERTHSSLGSISDNLRFVSKYICSCGTQTETIAHSTSCNNDGSALDTYQLNCNSCGREEKINFHMMRKALQDNEHKSSFSRKRSTIYPYL